METIRKYRDWFDQNFTRIKKDYFHFLTFQSVSTDDAYRGEVLNCANFLCKYLNDGGISSQLIETTGNPIVYAEDLSAGPSAPTVLVYGHYDVQPPEPLDLWESPPFEPTERDGRIFARGASDNKGQIFYTILSLIASKALNIPLKGNIKLCIEGEEESGSIALSKALPGLKEKFKADSLLVVDFDSGPDGIPFVSLGARGVLALEVTYIGSSQDFHSGIMGGVAYNPNRALVEGLGSLWDENGRITIPGFYEGVREFTESAGKAYPFTKEFLKEEYGVEAIGGEKGKTLEESNWHLPTLEINGMIGGYTGKGGKTVIPSSASAKLTCRLVLDQDPKKIEAMLIQALKERAPKGIKVEIIKQGIAPAFRSDRNCPLAKAVDQSSSEVSGKKAAFVYSGGSIPIVAEFKEKLDVEAIGMGYALPSDQVHAPNEHFDMDRFEKGFLTVARIFQLL